LKKFLINSNPEFFKKVDLEYLSEQYLNNIYKNLHVKNLSFLGIWTGSHRVGKSVGACSFADILDPTFRDDLEKRVAYTPEEFMDVMEEEIRKKKIKGGACVWDETQIKHGARDWYTSINKSINAVIQAFGYLNPIVFFVTQDPSFIDSQPRKLFHSFYEIKRNDNRFNFVIPFNIKYNRRTGKPFYVYPRFKYHYYGSMFYRIKIPYIKMMKPDQELIKRYDAHSQKFKDEFLSGAREIAKALKLEDDQIRDEMLKKTDMDQAEVIADLLAKHLHDPIFLTKFGNYRAEEIRYEYNISFRKAKIIANRASIKRKDLLSGN